MIQFVVLARHPHHGWLLIHRGLNQIANLTPEEAESIADSDAVHRSVSKGFVAASYELTELCNVECVHCYLGDTRRHSVLSLEEQLELIDRIESTGAIWLQLTGGEPLSARTFTDVYRHAWDRGFLITVLTNGTLLSRLPILALFQERPPFRVSISIYGASRETYERVTRRHGSWSMFQTGLRAAREAGISLRLKVIELSDNAHEIPAMIEMAKQSEEYDHIREIIPTLAGDPQPLAHQTEYQLGSECWSGCDAGTASFHVRADGLACLCKIAREPSVPLIRVDELTALSRTALATPRECLACGRRGECHICPALHRLLSHSGSCPTSTGRC